MGEGDKRRDERNPVSLVVDYEGADDLVADYTENLSTGGIFVSTSRVLEIGSEVRLVLSFPGLLEPIRIAPRFELDVVFRPLLLSQRP